MYLHELAFIYLFIFLLTVSYRPVPLSLKELIACLVSLAYSAAPKIKVGLKNVCFNAKMRIELQNLVGRIPICGSLCCFFLNKPEIDFDLTNVGNMMDFAPLKKKIRSIIQDSLAAMMVCINFEHIVEKTHFNFSNFGWLSSETLVG